MRLYARRITRCSRPPWSPAVNAWSCTAITPVALAFNAAYSVAVDERWQRRRLRIPQRRPAAEDVRVDSHRPELLHISGSTGDPCTSILDVNYMYGMVDIGVPPRPPTRS